MQRCHHALERGSATSRLAWSVSGTLRCTHGNTVSFVHGETVVIASCSQERAGAATQPQLRRNCPGSIPCAAFPPLARHQARLWCALKHLLLRCCEISGDLLMGGDWWLVGSGKSLCFQLPALLARGTVVVISPLISLMRDQHAQMQGIGIRSCFLGSAQTDASVEGDALCGRYQLIYACPETALRISSGLAALEISLIAVDEAHVVSQWGHDFRPKYRQLAGLVQTLRCGRLANASVPIMALTATATPRVREDIIETLGLRSPQTCVNSFHRPNLAFQAQPTPRTRAVGWPAGHNRQ